MALKEVYDYLYDNNLLESDNFEFAEILARHLANLPVLLDLSVDCEDIIEEIKEDINQYNEDEPTWVFFEEKEGVCIPSDYLLENHDLLDEDDYHLTMNLKNTLRVFELLNEI